MVTKNTKEMKLLNNKANTEVVNMVRATKNKINIISGNGMFNARCHENAVHAAIGNKDKKIAMCVCVDGDFTMIHFVNVDSDGVFTDNTLGYFSGEYEYFLIKYIDDVDFFNIHDIFKSYRKEIRKGLSFIVRLLSNIEF